MMAFIDEVKHTPLTPDGTINFDNGLSDIAFKVDAYGNPVPKWPLDVIDDNWTNNLMNSAHFELK